MSFIKQIKRNGRIYYAEVESKRVDGKVRHKYIRYIGALPDKKKSIFPSNIDELSFDACRISGSIISLDWLAKRIGLYDLLGEHAHPILTLVFAHCHAYQSTSKAALWFKKTDLSRIFKSERMSDARLRESIYALSRINLLEMQKFIFGNIMAFTGHDDSSILYDVTNTYFTGNNCRMAKMGLDKEGVRGRRLIQIGLAVTKKGGFPIFHQIHPGNIHDSKMFNEAIVNIRLFGIRKGIIIYDRGMSSKESTFELSNDNWKIIAGMPAHTGIKKIITRMNFQGIESYRNWIKQGETTFYFKTKKYTFGKEKGRLFILLNPFKKEVQQQKRFEKIAIAQKNFHEKKAINNKEKKFLNKDGKINTKAIKRAEKLDGISCIFTNSKFATKEVVKIYFDRALIERSFQTLKGALGLRPVRFWLEENVTVHLFICYLAYALMTTFRFQIEKARGEPGFSKLDDITTEEAFEELTESYRVYFHKHDPKNPDNLENSQLSKLVTLSKLQETILKAISSDLLL